MGQLSHMGLLLRVVTGLLCLSMSITSSLADTRVIDGDTIEVAGNGIRLHGIDAPEAGQKCNDVDGGTWQCGRAAISAMEGLIGGKAVKCDDRGSDGYGRTISVCQVDGVDLGEAMVGRGMAWAFRKYSEDYIADEQAARASKSGIWREETQTPWDFRATRWEAAVQEAPDGCPIKGNISENGRIYHAPWSPWYAKTRINLKKGERWFCDEAEAVAAGWRAPYWGQ
jgi:endonuclease YncB( thermonuclease family)